MIKKLLLTSLIFIASLALVGCVENEPEKVITLTVNNEFGELTEGDTLQLSYGTNDAEGVT